ncbi:MAG TPA: hypothetical protein ENJ00_04870 [Phycisphaerales bacterium]|nr:hypothetical protein [Phycisphaerales bacterium]
MGSTRYNCSRTLVRRACRVPGEDRASFREKLRRLKTLYLQFNVDTAELCQWLMRLRKRYGDQSKPASFGVLCDFFLDPETCGLESDEKQYDRWRRDVFDHVAGFRSIDRLSDDPLPRPIPDQLAAAMQAAVDDSITTQTTSSTCLFQRLEGLDKRHRLVLLKSAAEWMVARYQRGMENWVRQHAEWEDEKEAWEKAHPELTPEIRERFTGIFSRLKVSGDESGTGTSEHAEPVKTGVRRKNPRICRYERLRKHIDNCCYAGDSGHSPLCWKFAEFQRDRLLQNKQFNKKAFKKNASKLASICHERRTRPSKLFLSPKAADLILPDTKPGSRPTTLKSFKADWQAYLKFMGINEETAVAEGRLPHCLSIGKKHEESTCLHNKHTDLCNQYSRLLNAEFAKEISRDADGFTKLEGTYRDWRRYYLAGPSKPSFRYPSSKSLPMPKVFGSGFFELDMDRSVVRLRLDDAASEEWMEIGFDPWPRQYSPSRDQVADRVSSIHVNFASPTRVRLGFHFRVEHRPSRFGCTQDELDLLRSRTYPREAQDKAFLAAARKRLLDSWTGEDPDSHLRLLAVDMGTGGAHVMVFEGRKHGSDEPLRINKGDRLYDTFPDKKPKDKGGKDKNNKNQPAAVVEVKGLRKEHVGRHLAAIAEQSARNAAYRQEKLGDQTSVPHASDSRALKIHIARMVKDWARLNASQIIKAAEKHNCDLIVFESLRSKPKADYNKLSDRYERQKAERVIYAFGRVRQKVKEKAVERGMRVVTVPYFKSSQHCSTCGRVMEDSGAFQKNKKRKKFICDHKDCQAYDKPIDSDANAARVLGRVFWGEITLPDPAP